MLQGLDGKMFLLSCVNKGCYSKKWLSRSGINFTKRHLRAHLKIHFLLELNLFSKNGLYLMFWVI